MNARERYEGQQAVTFQAIGYAHRVIARMPNDTLADRKARSMKYLAIMAEWDAARRRWGFKQP